MKTFNDLEFKPHKNLGGEAKHAVMFFPNGYGVSVVTGSEFFYISPTGQFELAVIKGNPEDAHIAYDTGITSDVLGHLTENDVTEVMLKVQNLRPAYEQ